VLQVMKKALASTPGIILFLESWPKGWRETGLMPQKVLADLLSWGFVLKRMEGKTGRMESIEYRNVSCDPSNSAFGDLSWTTGKICPPQEK